ncbi:Beta-ketoacyl synthase [Catenulispora acidiphila DSM 44928]|uniref:Beta-ketoacyl synthase n=1 Tax=Catenulispora acidiphila (strain DSM 44928 / JCM 14897 / NBRC 102108 / NRRL B-24433 / ID139908) TaxID=479433 RepID=C7PWQ6_CATAD|nr:beta-ketoacyl synthase N-terminal-like domain-containing protein [Catenulispora acidiphila]ACU75336.1 Beta-ketoacyl synthase [Catenulispora acidiphila DSM 44928]
MSTLMNAGATTADAADAFLDAAAGAPRTAHPVITGIGIAAPTGLDLAAHWTATVEGRSGIVELEGLQDSAYPSLLAGTVAGFDDARRVPSRLLPQTDRVTRLALHAAQQALLDAGADTTAASDEEFRMGVVLSNGQGGFEFTHREFRKLWSKGPGFVSVYESFAWFYACNTGQISIRHALRGPSAALVADQAGGLDAIGYARRGVRRGTSLVLTGGLDSALDPWGFASQHAPGDTARGVGAAYLPFSPRARGHVPGEGGAVLVLEDAESAAARGAKQVYGAVSGYRASFDPAPGSDRPPTLERAIRGALADAGLEPCEVDAVFADGAGNPAADASEAAALAAVFGPHGVPVTVPKTLTGRLCAGGGPLDVATALLAIRAGLIPPSGPTDAPDRQYRLDLVRQARPARLRNVLILARGRGGFNSALVLSAPPTALSHH